MADQKISGLPQDSSLDANHYVPLVDPTGPTTKRMFLSILAAWLFDALNIPGSATGSPIFRDSETLSDHVVSKIGVAPTLRWTADSAGVNRNASMSAGTVYINGQRVPVAAVTARTFTASKDTYVDVGTDGVLVYTEVANGAASPALVANRIRLAKIVTGATTIAAASSITQRLTDSLGNQIFPMAPINSLRVVPQVQTVALSGATNSGTDVALTGSITAKLPANGTYAVRATVRGSNYNNSAGQTTVLPLKKNGADTVSLDGITRSQLQMRAGTGDNDAPKPYMDSVITTAVNGDVFQVYARTTGGSFGGWAAGAELELEVLGRLV